MILEHFEAAGQRRMRTMQNSKSASVKTGHYTIKTILTSVLSVV